MYCCMHFFGRPWRRLWRRQRTDALALAAAKGQVVEGLSHLIGDGPINGEAIGIELVCLLPILRVPAHAKAACSMASRPAQPWTANTRALLRSPHLWMFQTEIKMSEPGATAKPANMSASSARLIRTGGCGYRRSASQMTRVVRRSALMSSTPGRRSPTTSSTCQHARARADSSPCIEPGEKRLTWS